MEKPSAKLFDLIDASIVISGGFSIFASGNANIVPYFTSPSVGYSYNREHTVVDFLLDIAHGVERPTDQRVPEAPLHMQDRFEDSGYGVYNMI